MARAPRTARPLRAQKTRRDTPLLGRWPWSRDAGLLSAWVEGKTGIPFIDCFMRELAATGYCNHMGRETSGWFLVCDLGLDWRLGAYWFESVLIDFEPAANWLRTHAIMYQTPDRVAWRRAVSAARARLLRRASAEPFAGGVSPSGPRSLPLPPAPPQRFNWVYRCLSAINKPLVPGERLQTVEVGNGAGGGPQTPQLVARPSNSSSGGRTRGVAAMFTGQGRAIAKWGGSPNQQQGYLTLPFERRDGAAFRSLSAHPVCDPGAAWSAE